MSIGLKSQFAICVCPSASAVRLQFYIFDFLNTTNPIVITFGLKHLYDNSYKICKIYDLKQPGLHRQVQIIK